MRVNPHLSFNGTCREAFELYAATLGGEIVFSVTYRDTPMATRTPADWRDKIAHSRLSIRGQEILGADPPPERYQTPRGFSIMLGVDEPAEASRIFTILSEKGSVEMPLQETFWSRRFGACTDRFGITWMINCEKSREEVAGAVRNSAR
jgi:PhnB protein